jgi:hypothetical protein
MSFKDSDKSTGFFFGKLVTNYNRDLMVTMKENMFQA